MISRACGKPDFGAKTGIVVFLKEKEEKTSE